jgi:hypothetical protein
MPVVVWPVKPGVGPEPASWPVVLQGPALAAPMDNVMAANARISSFLIQGLLIF